MKNRLCFFILFLILILGFFLRIVNLQNLPHGFFCDEASIGYNAYSLLKTGKDEHGKPWPLFFQAFGEYKGPIQIYSTIPFVAIFGLNEFSVRLVSAVYGTLTILAVYLLTKKILEPRTIRLNSSPKPSNFEPAIAALLLSISPWHIHFSRAALEGLAAFLFFTTLGTWLFFRAFKNKNQLLVFSLALLVFSLSLYSYFPARIFIPLFLTGLILIFRKSLKPKIVLLGGFFFLLLSLPLVIHMVSGEGFSRWKQVSVFKEKNCTQALKQIKDNYLSHFSLDFLFKKGDAGMQAVSRHSVRGMGELYWFQLPLIVLGILGFWRLKKYRELVLLLWWLVIYPLGSVLTQNTTPQTTRSIIGIIPFQILSAIGFCFVLNLFSSYKTSFRKMSKNTDDRPCFWEAKFKILWSFLLVLSILFLTGLAGAEFARYLNLYFNDYPNYSSGYYGWQWGFREIMEDFSQRENYDELLITHRFNMGEEILKFYQVTIPCQKCKIASNPITFNLTKNQLFALRKEGVEELEKQGANFVTRKTLYYSNREEAFFIGEIE